MNEFLLSIAIPTYNRHNYLDICLEHICKQIQNISLPIEVIISDNNSSDLTNHVVDKYLQQGYKIRYVKNSENLGAELNVIQCFELANGKYVWVFGDDDILLDGALEKIVSFLVGGDYGDVFINSYSFKDCFEAEKPVQRNKRTIVYSNKHDFLLRVNYWTTFITANIINKSLYDSAINTKVFEHSNLPQLAWIFSAILNTNKNAVFNEYLIAAKAQNSGGYGLCQVFGQNFNRIMNYFIPYGMKPEYISIINKKLLLTFFPGFIMATKGSCRSFENESFYRMLFDAFHKYLLFWLLVVPISVLPTQMGWVWFFPFRVYNKLKKIQSDLC